MFTELTKLTNLTNPKRKTQVFCFDIQTYAACLSNSVVATDVKVHNPSIFTGRESVLAGWVVQHSHVGILENFTGSCCVIGCNIGQDIVAREGVQCLIQKTTKSDTKQFNLVFFGVMSKQFTL